MNDSTIVIMLILSYHAADPFQVLIIVATIDTNDFNEYNVSFNKQLPTT